ncbi:MAG: radical SAM/SPASM domain-containing protein [Thermoanaerobaculia bacterium]
MTDIGAYGDFSANLHAGMARQQIPANVMIEISRRCPLNCSHCYNNLPMGDVEAKSGELTYAEHCRILDELAEAGCLWICFTGGEIFARMDFLDIYTYAKKKGFIVTLFTNGTLITPKIADYLAEWRPFSIEITLYGRTKETYERLTRVPGSYERCLRGIQLLKERGLSLALKTVAVTVNKHEIWEMKRFVQEDLGLPFKFDPMINARIDCSLSPLAVRLSPPEIVEMDLEDPGRVAEWKTFSSRFIGPSHAPGKEDELYHCGGGISSFALDPAGRMSICVLSHFDTYDLRHGTLDEGWNHFLARVREKKVNRVTKCNACHLKSVCGMCPANGELESGDPESPVDFLCHTAHLRAEVFGWNVQPHGECEYCEGGSGYSTVQVEASLVRERKPVAKPGGFLPSLASGPGTLPSAGSGCTTGCGSCGGH